MDCSTAYVPTNVVKDSPGSDSSSSDELIPLSKLLERPQSDEKQSRENRHSLTSSSGIKSKKDRSASDDSSDDDKPLTKMKKISAPAKKPVKKDNTLTRNGKKAGDLNTDDSSDNEPLIKVTKVASKAAKKPFRALPRKSVDTKKKESLDDNDASEDEPLSILAKKLYPKRQRKTFRNANMKSKRSASRKTINYAESSSDSSDDEPLATLKRKQTKAPIEQKILANSKKTKLEDISLKDSSLSDDDVPSEDLDAKKKPVRKNAKKTAVLHGRASRKTQGRSDESAEDEPLINLVKKNNAGTRKKASVPKKRGTTSRKPRKMPVAGSSSNSSDDEPFRKAAKHPQVTKIVKIILKRCDGEETGVHEA